MNTEIVSAYIELQNLKKGSMYSIAQINWWLLKYGDLYTDINHAYNKLCDTCVVLSKQQLPYNCLKRPDYCSKKPEFKPFLNFFDELDKATQLHKLEPKCRMAYDEYLSLGIIEEDLKSWLIKHYDIYYQLGGYFYQYMEFNSNNDKTLHIAEAPDESFGIVIGENDFINSIRFYDVYDDLYHTKKLYPEKIKEWDEFFSKIKLPKNDL